VEHRPPPLAVKLSNLKLPDPAQQIAFEEYMQSIEKADARLKRLAQVIASHLQTWRWKPLVDALQAFRGIETARPLAQYGQRQTLRSPLHRSRTCHSSSDLAN
jgi:hypothetical protein